jgi:PhnB protein
MVGEPIREGFHTVTPYLLAREADDLVAFVKQAFGATETFRAPGGAGGLHIEVRIGDSMVMIGGGAAWGGELMPAMLHLYVEDVDAVYRRALGAGAAAIEEPADQPDGDRRAGVKDPFGNQWYIATHQG